VFKKSTDNIRNQARKLGTPFPALRTTRKTLTAKIRAASKTDEAGRN
jgi:hypothetical protein